MSYSYEKKDDAWRVVEKPSGIVMIQNVGRNKARGIARSLNLGAGFRGKTPAFFSYTYGKQKGDSQA